MISKIYLFCALLVEVLLIYINVATESKIAWSAITGLGFFYGYMLIRFAILGKTGYRAKITVLTLMAILIVIAIDFLVGYRGWSVNYALPSAIILVDIGIIICMIVNRRNWQSYMMWQIFMILCSIVPVMLIFTGIVTAQLFALIAFAFSLFLFLGTLIIGDRRARVELKCNGQDQGPQLLPAQGSSGHHPCYPGHPDRGGSRQAADRLRPLDVRLYLRYRDHPGSQPRVQR